MSQPAPDRVQMYLTKTITRKVGSGASYHILVHNADVGDHGFAQRLGARAGNRREWGMAHPASAQRRLCGDAMCTEGEAWKRWGRNETVLAETEAHMAHTVVAEHSSVGAVADERGGRE